MEKSPTFLMESGPRRRLATSVHYKTCRTNAQDHQQLASFINLFQPSTLFTKVSQNHTIKMHFTSMLSIVAILGAAVNAAPSLALAAEVKNSTSFLAPSADVSIWTMNPWTGSSCQGTIVYWSNPSAGHSCTNLRQYPFLRFPSSKTLNACMEAPSSPFTQPVIILVMAARTPRTTWTMPTPAMGMGGNGIHRVGR